MSGFYELVKSNNFKCIECQNDLNVEETYFNCLNCKIYGGVDHLNMSIDDNRVLFCEVYPGRYGTIYLTNYSNSKRITLYTDNVFNIISTDNLFKRLETLMRNVEFL